MDQNQIVIPENPSVIPENPSVIPENPSVMPADANVNENPNVNENANVNANANEMPTDTNEITYKKGDEARNIAGESVTIYWKYENPSDKDDSFTKKNFLDQFVRELDAKRATNDISNPYIISDKMYNEKKNKTDEVNKKIDNDKHEREYERIMNSGEEYAVVLNKLWNNIINEDTTVEKNGLPTKKKFLNFQIFFNYLRQRRPGFEERLGVNRSYKYYYVSKREKIDNKIQKCNPSDFLINDPNFLENWKLVKKQIRQYQQLGCRSRFEGVDGNKCILDDLISLVRDIEKESEECFGGFFERGFKTLTTNVANKIRSNPQAEMQAKSEEEKKTGFFSKMFGKKGGRTKKRNSNRKKTKRSKRSKKSKK